MSKLSSVNERPILMTPENAQKCHDGTKTQTRRTNGLEVVNHQGTRWGCPQMTRPGVATFLDLWLANPYDNALDVVCLYGQVGDRLWVRENGWERPARTPKMMRDGADTWEPFYFDALLDPGESDELKGYGFKRRPSIHMPRKYCRTVLEITAVRVERVQEITVEDCQAEGVTGPHMVGYPAYRIPGDSKPRYSSAVAAYEDIWESINGEGSWERNDWVWVVSFKKVKVDP